MYFSVCEILSQADTVRLWPAPPRRVFQVTQDGTGCGHLPGDVEPLWSTSWQALWAGASPARGRPFGMWAPPAPRLSGPAPLPALAGWLQAASSKPRRLSQAPRALVLGLRGCGGGSLLVCSPSRLSAGLLPSRSRSVTLTHRTLIVSGQPHSGAVGCADVPADPSCHRFLPLIPLPGCSSLSLG